MEINIKIKTTLDTKKLQALFTLLGLMTANDYENKGLTESEIKIDSKHNMPEYEDDYK